MLLVGHDYDVGEIAIYLFSTGSLVVVTVVCKVQNLS